jgi:Fe-S oxidoreductase
LYELKYDEAVCEQCETVDCLVKCRCITLDRESAKEERLRLIRGEDSRVLKDCTTCYACEEYCPHGNHPFYLLVDRQEQSETWPVPVPLTKQQIKMMAPKGRIGPEKVQAPILNMCYFPMLKGCIQGRLFEGVSTIVGSDIFCNIMWLHFAKNSTIRERLPQVVDNIWQYYLRDSGTQEVICYHDECYGTYTQLAPAFGIDVPFKPIHLFQFLTEKLAELKDQVRPLGMRVAYQRPCSNRLVPETQHWVDEIFERVGVERVDREYDRENALCCGGILRLQQREELADDILKKNLDDMSAAGATVCVFNCPACFFTMGQAAAERGLMPILMSDLCRAALGEKWWGVF